MEYTLIHVLNLIYRSRPLSSSSGTDSYLQTSRSNPLTLLVQCVALLFQESAYLPGVKRHVYVGHPKRPESVNNSVNECGWGSNSCGLTHTFGTQRVVGRWGYCFICFPLGCLHSRRYCVIHEVGAIDVTSLVIANFLHEGCTEAHCESPMYLTINYKWVDYVTAVVDGDKPSNLHFSCTPIYVYNADIATEGESHVGWVIVVNSLQPRLHAWWGIRVCREGHVLNGLILGGCALNIESATLPHHILFPSLQEVGGYLLCLLTDFA